MKKLLSIFAILVIASQVNAHNSSTNSKYDDVIFTTVEESLQFVDGTKAMYEFIYSNLKYPTNAMELKISGKIFLKKKREA